MIVHLFNSSSISGPERLVLPALASAGEQFLIINLREERLPHLRESDPLEDYARSLGLDFLDIRVCGHWDNVAVRELSHILERLDPDLVHAHDVKASAYLMHAHYGTQRTSPIVSTHHGVQGRPDWKTKLYEWVYRQYVLKSFDRVFCVSNSDYHFLLKSGIDPKKLRLHLNGIDAHFVPKAQRAEESKKNRTFWLPHEPDRDRLFLFGAIGRLSAEKDHARLFSVLAHLRRMPGVPPWRCLLFGNGPLEAPLRNLATKLGLDDHLVWMGYQKNVGNQLAGLDMVLSFSKAEGLPINILEAGWAGTPVMCTQVGGIQDIIPDESYGYLIPPHEGPAKSALRLKDCLTPEGRAILDEKALRFQTRVSTEFTRAKWLTTLKASYDELHVALSDSQEKVLWSRFGAGTEIRFGERIKSSILNRLMLYPPGRLEDIRRWNRNGFRILMYHRFFSSTPDVQEALARQCAHIQKYYTVVSLNDIARHLASGTPLPPDALAVTVDDGYRDFLCNGYPVFRAYHIPVTVYVVSAFIDGQLWLWWDKINYAINHTRRPFATVALAPHLSKMHFDLKTPQARRHATLTLVEALKDVRDSERLAFLEAVPEVFDLELPKRPPSALVPLEWSEVRYLSENGVDFGAHTHTHPILSRLTPENIEPEIVESKRRLEEALERPVAHFSYPNGLRKDINDEALAVIERCGFQTAVTAERGVNFQGSHRFWLRRIGVDPLMSKFNFEILLAGMGGSRSNQVPFASATQRAHQHCS